MADVPEKTDLEQAFQWHLKLAGRALSVLVPFDAEVCRETRELLNNKKVRVETLGTILAQDPMLVHELLRRSNSAALASKTKVVSVRTGIMTLGLDALIEMLDSFSKCPQISDPEICDWLDFHRDRCVRTGDTAKIISGMVASHLVDEAYVAGLFLFIGELVATSHLRERYVQLASELNNRSKLLYRLSQDYAFDVEEASVSFLSCNGLPDLFAQAVARDGAPSNPEIGLLKTVCFAAGEMVDTYDAEKWDRLEPGKTLPSKSALRMLRITEDQYATLYSKVTNYLQSGEVAEALNPEDNLEVGRPVAVETTPAPTTTTTTTTTTATATAAPPSPPKHEVPPAPAEEPPPPVKRRPGVILTETEPIKTKPKVVQKPADEPAADARKPGRLRAFSETLKMFGMDSSGAASRTEPIVEEKSSDGFNVPRPPPVKESKVKKVVAGFSNLCDEAETTEDLLSRSLDMLVNSGAFKKAALIVVSEGEKEAIVVACRGAEIADGQIIEIDDDLNPIAQSISKVQSFGNRSSKSSPFGSKAFAVAPILAVHETPVALYADCGSDAVLTFDARRIFRQVVELLNAHLPDLAGSIPNEIAKPKDRE